MTSIWGPAGWITLHSIALNYPINPTYNDVLILNSFMTSFANTIPCKRCKDDFGQMFIVYKKRYPRWSASRYDFFLFTLRAHNTVNRKLLKPVIETVAKCIKLLKYQASKTTFEQSRKFYISYIENYWKNLSIMNELNTTYWNVNSTDINTVSFPEADITTPIFNTDLLKDFISA
jgi:hypothetical protein